MSKFSNLIKVFILVSSFYSFKSVAVEISATEKPSLVCQNELAQLADSNLKVQVFAPTFENQNSRILVSKESEVQTASIYSSEVAAYKMADSSNSFSSDVVMLNVKASSDGQIHGKLTFKQGENLFYFILKCDKFYQIQPNAAVEE